mmetsp:Transcript_13503/g.38234  ORF Transcript_13503/g.38234 Transcript_13503/m.38234 type:complete len:702 (-) Transcript_13503:37-2142(-)
MAPGTSGAAAKGDDFEELSPATHALLGSAAPSGDDEDLVGFEATPPPHAPGAGGDAKVATEDLVAEALANLKVDTLEAEPLPAVGPAPGEGASGAGDDATAAAPATCGDAGGRQRRVVSVGWLPEQDDGLRIALAGLTVAVALNRERNPGVSMEDKVWFNTFAKKVITVFVRLSEEMVDGILPLGQSEADPEPLAAVWTERATQEARERAFGELFAQSILDIGTNSSLGDLRHDSRTHWCLMRVAHQLQIDQECLDDFGEQIAELVSESAISNKRAELTEEEQMEKKRRGLFRNLKIGAAAVVGATLVGVTGGLALPALGASIASFGGAAATTGAFMASAGGTALFTTLFTAGGARLTGYKMSRRIGGLKEFEFREISNAESGKSFPNGLHVVLCVSGWYHTPPRRKKGASTGEESRRNSEASTSTEEAAVEAATAAAEAEVEGLQHSETSTSLDDQARTEDEWSACVTNHRAVLGQPFHLVWETEAVKDVSLALSKFAVNQAVGTAVKEALKTTTLAAVLAAVAWPSFVISIFDYIDNSWAVAVNRAKLAGEELARAIISGAQGRRPVTLVGYSLGGLVVFHCLQYIAKKRKGKNGELDGLVLDAYILGAPVTAGTEEWASARSVVAGTLANGHASHDWILTVLFRASLGSLGRIAGLHAVEAPGVLNVDLSKVISTQMDYHRKIDECMDWVLTAAQSQL